MTFLWLVVWLLSQTPQVQMFGSWNSWGVALGVCVAIDLIGSLGARAWRQRPYRDESDPSWDPDLGWTHRQPGHQA